MYSSVMYCVVAGAADGRVRRGVGRGLRFDARANALADRLRRDAVLLVVLLLQLAPPPRLVDRPLHRVGHRVGVENHLGVDVAGRAADGLHQRRLAAQEAFLVGVENRHQRDFGQVQPFAQQVHADQRVELPFAQIAQQLDALEGVQLAVQPLAAHVLLAEDRRTDPRPAAW